VYEEDNWQAVLDHFNRPNEKYHEPLLVWIRPSIESIQFIETELKRQGIDKILSIGCGCGFFEWLISRVSAPAISQVCGLEVNSTWWESEHSTPHYIPLEYISPVPSPENDSDQRDWRNIQELAPLSHKGRNMIPEKFSEFCRDQSMAMLFCYFNQIQYFKEYLASYEGKCIILIGPVDGKRHCDPEPYYLHTTADDELRRQWDLVAYHDIKGEGEDLIAIYIRRIFE